MFLKEVCYAHKNSIYLCSVIFSVLLFIYFIYSCVGKAELSAAIIPVFSVT